MSALAQPRLPVWFAVDVRHPLPRTKTQKKTFVQLLAAGVRDALKGYPIPQPLLRLDIQILYFGERPDARKSLAVMQWAALETGCFDPGQFDLSISLHEVDREDPRVLLTFNGRGS